MLEKLLGSRSFGTTMGNLAHCQVTFLVSLRGLGLLLMVQCATLTFLECWTLILLTLVFRFQLDDHPTLLNVVAHVKTNIYFFQVTLWDTCAMLHEVI